MKTSIHLVLIMCCIGCQRTDDFKELLEEQRNCRGVIDALEDYHHRNNRYPERLDELISGGYLAHLPQANPRDSDIRYSLQYENNLEYDFYLLRFSGDVTEGLKPKLRYWSYYISDRAEWFITKYTVDIQGLIVERASNRYKDAKTGKALQTVIEALIKSRTAEDGLLLPVSRKQIELRLGAGKESTVNGMNGVIYATGEEKNIRYFLTYKNKTYEYSDMILVVIDQIFVAGPETLHEWKLRIKSSGKKIINYHEN